MNMKKYLIIAALAATSLPLASSACYTASGSAAIEVGGNGSEEAKSAATRVMNVLTNGGLIAGEDAAELRDELTGIFAKNPMPTDGDPAKNEAAMAKVKEQVQAAVVRRVGKDKSAQVAELLGKAECWEAKACAKSCCAGKH